MTITFEMDTDEAEQLARRAELAGLPVSQLVTHWVSQTLRAPERLPRDTRPPAERLESFHQWVNSHPRDTPLLTDAEISREAIYARDDED